MSKRLLDILFECLLSKSNLLCQTEFLISPFPLHNPTSLTIFDISVNGTSILLAAKTKNIEIIFDSFLSFHNLYLI